MSIAAVRRGFESLITFIVIVLMIALAVEVTAGVVFRMIGRSLAWYDEVAAVMLAWLTYYGAVLAALKRAHIAFPGIVQAMPAPWRLTITLAVEAVVIGFFLLMAWYGWVVIGILGEETLVTVDIPVALTQSVIPVGALLYVVAELLCLPDLVRQARGVGSVDMAEQVAGEVSH